MSRLTPCPLSPDEESFLSGNENPEFVRDKLKEIDSGQYLAVARVGISCSADGHLDRLRQAGVDVGIDNNEYGFHEVVVDKSTKELRVYRN